MTQPANQPTPDLTLTDTGAVITFADRCYRIRGLDSQLDPGRLKVRITVSRCDLAHIDTLDLYVARLRQAFIRAAAAELYVDQETIKRDLGRLLLKLEELQDQRLRSQAAAAPEPPVQLTDREQQEALALLEEPRLLERILADYDHCGLVGEPTNKLLLYLACTSRLLDRPLAVLVQSASAAGKTSLLSAALGFMPPEQRVEYSALTGQALYYMGPTDLQHKILALAETEGVAEAAYALKLLQSDGRLTIAATERQDHGGRQQTRCYRVEGPVAMLLSRQNIAVIDREKYADARGLEKGAYIISEAAGEDPELIIIATGSEVEVEPLSCFAQHSIPNCKIEVDQGGCTFYLDSKTFYCFGPVHCQRMSLFPFHFPDPAFAYSLQCGSNVTESSTLFLPYMPSRYYGSSGIQNDPAGVQSQILYFFFKGFIALNNSIVYFGLRVNEASLKIKTLFGICFISSTTCFMGLTLNFLPKKTDVAQKSQAFGHPLDVCIPSVKGLYFTKSLLGIGILLISAWAP